MGARGCNTLARGCGGIIPPRIKVYNSPSCGILPSTGKSLNTGRPPKRSEHGKHQIQSKRQTVFRGERKLQGAVGQAGESLQERIRREELQKLQVTRNSKRPADAGRFEFTRLVFTKARYFSVRRSSKLYYLLLNRAIWMRFAPPKILSAGTPCAKAPLTNEGFALVFRGVKMSE